MHDTNNSSNNNDPKPLHPLAAVGYVLMEQKCSLSPVSQLSLRWWTRLQKYQQDSEADSESSLKPDPSDTMSTPVYLPPSDEPPTSNSTAHVCEINDMGYASAFKEKYLLTNKQMNWKICYEKGFSEGHFTNYKSYKTVMV
ncbi:hypothetical protein INT45_012316 [Circinella minor]|uniref:Uncharacterized protein n=1 Tax=Circinella minor TaxID=1195481 RepID=A0A8H7S7A6_9FUNG|nr:hypothetical protein INT45_012316 [Circinella minor]